jgi:hypothetical protein
MNAATNGAATGPDRAAISRRNGAKSRGPRTAEGKNRSKFNALKHGMTARTLVLPGEDPAELQRRVESWSGDLRPRNETERYLVARAAAISWQLDRTDRADAARLATCIRTGTAGLAHREPAEAEALGRRLFHGSRTSFTEYAELEIEPGPKPRALGASALAADPDHAATLVFELESTAAGCLWLLDRWADLRDHWNDGQGWGWFERFCALRLLGKQTLGASNDPVIDAILPREFRIEDSMQADQDDGWELAGTEFVDEPLDQDVADCGSSDAAAARQPGTPGANQTVTKLMSAAIARLGGLARAHRESAKATLAEQAARLSFDSGDEAERLRRYQVACNRNLLRTLDAFFKVRASADQTTRSECPAPDLDHTHTGPDPEPVSWMKNPDVASQVLDVALDRGLADPADDLAERTGQQDELLHSCIDVVAIPSEPTIPLLCLEQPLKSTAIVEAVSAAGRWAPDRPPPPEAAADTPILRNEPGVVASGAEPSMPPEESERFAAPGVERDNVLVASDKPWMEIDLDVGAPPASFT